MTLAATSTTITSYLNPMEEDEIHHEFGSSMPYNDYFTPSLFSEEAIIVRRLQASNTTTTTTTADSDSDDGENQGILATVLSYIFLFLLIFGLSATVDVRNLKKQLQNRFALCTGVAMQYLIMPVLGYVAVVALQRQPGFTKEIAVTLLVVTSSPGGSYSNWWCSLFNADLALSVAMTTVSTIMSMFMLPFNLFVYTFLAFGRNEENSVVKALDFGTIFTAIGIVLLAISLGLYASYRFDSPTFHVAANRLGSVAGILLVLFSIFMSSGSGGAENKFWNQDWSFYVGVSFPFVVGMFLANVLSRLLGLKKPETVAIAIECSYQNTGIATSVAIAMYSNVEERARAVAVPLFYGVVEAVAIAIYCVIAWKLGWTKAPKDEKLCIVMGKSYEINQHDDDDDDHDKEDEARDNGDDDDEESPSEATSHFVDEGLAASSSLRGDLDNDNDDDNDDECKPFWTSWFNFGRDRDSALLSATTTSSSNNKDPFRNDAALAAVVAAASFSSISTTTDAKISTSKDDENSPAVLRKRSSTVETTASSKSSGSSRSPVAAAAAATVPVVVSRPSPLSPSPLPTEEELQPYEDDNDDDDDDDDEDPTSTRTKPSSSLCDLTMGLQTCVSAAREGARRIRRTNRQLWWNGLFWVVV